MGRAQQTMCYHLYHFNHLGGMQEPRNSPTVSRDNSAEARSTRAVSRRVLVVSAPSTGEQDMGQPFRFRSHPRGLQVDYCNLELLELGTESRTASAVQPPACAMHGDRLAVFSMLSKYQLILVPGQRIRQSLCAEMPGLANHVFSLDCFDGNPPLQPPGDHHQLGHPDPTHPGLTHWSTFLSNLAV